LPQQPPDLGGAGVTGAGAGVGADVGADVEQQLAVAALLALLCEGSWQLGAVAAVGEGSGLVLTDKPVTLEADWSSGCAEAEILPILDVCSPRGLNPVSKATSTNRNNTNDTAIATELIILCDIVSLLFIGNPVNHFSIF
jgi:hypothetical protein